jgi:hypothetical protein
VDRDIGIPALRHVDDRRLGHLEDEHLGRFLLDHFFARPLGAPLTRRHILDRLFVLVTELLDPDLGFQEDRVKGRRTGGIRVDLSPDVHAALAHPRQQLMDQVVSGIVEMTGQRRSAQCRRIGEQFLDAVGLCGVGSRRVAEVGTGLPTIEAGQLLYLEQLAGRNATSHVTEGGADAETARGQSHIEEL